MKKTEFWAVSVLAAVALVLAVANMLIFGQNRDLQVEINSQAQYIQQSVQLEGLYREIVKALADLSVRNQDQDLKNLLAAQGISVTLNAPAAPAPPPGAAPRK